MSSPIPDSLPPDLQEAAKELRDLEERVAQAQNIVDELRRQWVALHEAYRRRLEDIQSARLVDEAIDTDT